MRVALILKRRVLDMIHKGLKGVTCTETDLCDIDGEKGVLIYRGYDAKELAQKHTFEEVAHLLWYGRLPKQNELEELKEKFQQSRDLPQHLKVIINEIPKEQDMLDVIRTAISAFTLTSYEKPLIDDAIRLTSVIPAIIAYRDSIINQTEMPEIRTDLDHVAYYLYLIQGKLPDQSYVEALKTYMILTMEHGLNASTFSARVTASTESDLISSITAAVGTMKGPLHGGAPTGVIELLNECATANNIEHLIKNKIINGEKLMGFGHRVYKTVDPRAEALKNVLMKEKRADDWFDLALNVEKTAIKALAELKPGRGLYTNVEYYAAAIMKELNLPSNLFTATFTASRIVGWTAHVIEQLEDNVIFRPQAKYVGPMLTSQMK